MNAVANDGYGDVRGGGGGDGNVVVGAAQELTPFGAEGEVPVSDGAKLGSPASAADRYSHSELAGLDAAAGGDGAGAGAGDDDIINDTSLRERVDVSGGGGAHAFGMALETKTLTPLILAATRSIATHWS